jgi:hypothetical protein
MLMLTLKLVLLFQPSPLSPVDSMFNLSPKSTAALSISNLEASQADRSFLEHTPALPLLMLRVVLDQLLDQAPVPVPDLLAVLALPQRPQLHLTVSTLLSQVFLLLEVYFVYCCRLLERRRFFPIIDYIRPNMRRLHFVFLYYDSSCEK